VRSNCIGSPKQQVDLRSTESVILPEEIEQGVTLYIRVLRPYVSEAGHALEVNTPETHPLLQEQTNQE